jgi:uncharacterized NAD-dependent epimerase/dehydratase family protein
VFDELLDLIFPGGALVGIGVAIGATFSKQLRPVAKQAIKAGMDLSERLREAAAEASERAQDLMAEAQVERRMEQQQNGEAARRTQEKAPVSEAPRSTARTRTGAGSQGS